MDDYIREMFIALGFGILIGGLLVGAFAAVNMPQQQHGDTAKVSCSTFVSEDGTADAICFVSGDVEFSWIGNGTTENGTISLDELPTENSTVRVKP